MGWLVARLCQIAALRDRDGKYGDAFDAVFEAGELRVIATAPRAPRMNAHCERIIGSIRREVLDHVLILGEAHARQVLAAYQAHYNRHRPHQARASDRQTSKNTPHRCMILMALAAHHFARGFSVG